MEGFGPKILGNVRTVKWFFPGRHATKIRHAPVEAYFTKLITHVQVRLLAWLGGFNEANADGVNHQNFGRCAVLQQCGRGALACHFGLVERQCQTHIEAATAAKRMFVGGHKIYPFGGGANVVGKKTNLANAWKQGFEGGDIVHNHSFGKNNAVFDVDLIRIQGE